MDGECFLVTGFEEIVQGWLSGGVPRPSLESSGGQGVQARVTGPGTGLCGRACDIQDIWKSSPRYNKQNEAARGDSCLLTYESERRGVATF